MSICIPYYIEDGDYDSYWFLMRMLTVFNIIASLYHSSDRFSRIFLVVLLRIRVTKV